MGLTIHYELSVTKNLLVAVVRELAQRTVATSLHCGRSRKTRTVYILR